MSLRNGKKSGGLQVGPSVFGENEMEGVHHSDSRFLKSGASLIPVSYQLAVLAKLKKVSVNLSFLINKIFLPKLTELNEKMYEMFN